MSRFEQVGVVVCNDVFLDCGVDDVVRTKLSYRCHFVETADPDTTDFQLVLNRRYVKHPLIVQYGEADSAFLLRLVGDLGVSFFFEQGSTHERLVITDENERFHLGASEPRVDYAGDGSAHGIFSLEEHRTWVPRSHSIRNYDARHPTTLILGIHALDREEAYGGVDEFGGHVASAEEAQWLAALRVEQAACRAVRFRGRSTVLALAAGTRTVLAGHPHFPRGKNLLLLEVRHNLSLPTPWDEGRTPTYANEFVASDGDIPFRSQSVTNPSRVPGVVTGTIVAKDGVSPTTGQVDGEGCYRVQFQFDAKEYGATEPAPRVRMAQLIAGADQGAHLPLRVGTEVLIAFVNGDPSRPVILAAVPNAHHPAAVTSSERAINVIRTAEKLTIRFGRSDVKA